MKVEYKCLTVLLLTVWLASAAVILPGSSVSAAIPDDDGTKLKFHVVPEASKIAADGLDHPVFVEIQTEDGKPAFAPADLTVYLYSSRIDVGDISRQIVIPRGETFGVAKFLSTGNAGSVEITAVAFGYLPGTATPQFITPAGNPAKLAVFVIPAKLNAKSVTYPSIVVQLRDAEGKPALASQTTTVSLSSSAPLCGMTSPVVDVKAHSSYSVAGLSVSDLECEFAVTAAASGYSMSSAEVETFLFQTNLDFDRPDTAFSVDDNIPLSLSASVYGLPIAGAPIMWSGQNGSLSAYQDTTGSDGVSTSIYQPQQSGLNTVTATLTKPGYTTATAALTLLVNSKVNLYVHILTVQNTSLPNVEVTLIQQGGVKLRARTNSTGVAVFENMRWGKASTTVPGIIAGSQQGVRYVFGSWAEGQTNLTRSDLLVVNREMEAVYKVQYLLTITSPFGDVQQQTWCDAGTRINFGVSVRSVQTSPLDIYEFAGWSGSYQGEEPFVSLTMNSPKQIEAIWRPSYQPKIVTSVAVASAGAALTVFFFRVRKKKKEDPVKWDEVDYESLS